MIRILILLLTFSACCGAVKKDNEKTVTKVIEVFVHRLGLLETHCSIDNKIGRCFAKTAAEGMTIYFVCERDNGGVCNLYEVVKISTGIEDDHQ
jgi:hypothetical protein